MAFRASFFAFMLSLVLSAGAAVSAERVDSASDSRTPATTGLPMPPAEAEILLPASTDPIPLASVRSANEQLYRDLESFVCSERIVRYEGSLDSDKARRIDTLTAKVSFENGVEQYMDIRQNKRPRSSLSSLSGAWSESEFGTLLRQTQLFLTTEPVEFLRNSDLDGAPAAVYAFDVSEQDSPWDLEVGGRHYQVPFRTEVWVSRDSAQILRLERRSSRISAATGISEIDWSVRLAPVEMNGHTWLLPKTARYVVSYQQSGRREWNEMSFSDYRRYGSEVALRFDDVK